VLQIVPDIPVFFCHPIKLVGMRNEFCLWNFYCTTPVLLQGNADGGKNTPREKTKQPFERTQRQETVDETGRILHHTDCHDDERSGEVSTRNFLINCPSL